jgi:hypothetical protein
MERLARHAPRLWRAALQLFRAASLLVVCAYLGLVLLHVLPENPLQRQLEPLNRQVVEAFFKQGWGMFAPGPPQVSWTLLARCHGAQEPSPWLDLTTARTRSARWNPFSMDLRLVSYLHETLRAEEVVREQEQKQRESPADEAQAQRLQRRRETLSKRWARIGSVACADALGEEAFTRVELKYVLQPLATWATRSQPPPAPTEEVLGTFARLEGRVRPGLFHAEVVP